MKRNPSKHRSKANPSSGSSIEKELMAAFAWAKIDSEERKDFKGKDLDALFAHAKEKYPFNYTDFSAQDVSAEAAPVGKEDLTDDPESEE
jgi:hypothetical protein